MPKASPLQPSFSAGEFSPRIFGRTDAERYKTGLAECVNYIPTIQGPLVRRPGTKYIADVKDPSKPPRLIPFKVSRTENYVLEFGHQYIRFHSTSGQILASSGHYHITTTLISPEIHPTISHGGGFAVRQSNLPRYGESQTYTSPTTSSYIAGQILEMKSPYDYSDLPYIKFAQKDRTMYLVNPKYPPQKLTQVAADDWTIGTFLLVDGPYLPFNTHTSTGDSARFTLIPGSGAKGETTLTAGTVQLVTNVVTTGAGLYRITTQSPHVWTTGDKVVVSGAVGGVGFDPNGTWTVGYVGANDFDLLGSNAAGSWTGSGFVYPKLFNNTGNGEPTEAGRLVSFAIGGKRYWGLLNDAMTTGYQANVKLYTTLPNTSAIAAWQMGVYGVGSSYPSSVCFHQNRLVFGGSPNYPQSIYASVSGDFENFQQTNSSYVVADSNALGFTLSSDQLNKIRWIKSESQGLLCGTLNGEWNISPSTQASALTPSNINAAQTSNYGSADIDAVQASNATLYADASQRKMRELNFFFQVNSYRSTDLSELSEHITAPSVKELAVQKDPVPIVWTLRSDGLPVVMSYNRDDTTLKVGWSRTYYGGQSDSGGSPPVVKSIAVIPASSGVFDQLWMATQRFINGTSVCQIEAMQKIYEEGDTQDQAFYSDCGSTFDNAKVISSITRAGSAIVTATSHGFSDGDIVRIDKVVGLNSSVLDANGVAVGSNLVNGNIFRAASTSANAFFLTDVNNGSSYIDSRAYSAYVSGGVARKQVTSISGLTWLKNETVSVLADGGVHRDVVVNSAGVIALDYGVFVAQVGLPYKSWAKTLRLDAGSGDGSAIGKIRRPSRAAFMVHNIGDLSFGTQSSRLIPIEFNQLDFNPADEAPPLYSGIIREGLESEFDFDGQIYFAQTTPQPGMIQSLTVMLEENDV